MTHDLTGLRPTQRRGWLRSTIFRPRWWLGLPPWSRTKNELTATVVVPAYNEEEFILSTLQSLSKQPRIDRVLIVDDASTDRTSEVVKEFIDNRYIGARPFFQLYRAPVNQGTKSQALNGALPLVKTDIFICVDADTTLSPRAVDELLYSFGNPQVGIACGDVNSRSTDTFWASARAGEYLVGQTLVKQAQGNMNNVLVASGCFFAIRTELLRSLGGFHERTMAEDMDATWQAVSLGWDVAFVHRARCTVDDPRTWKVYRAQIERWYRGYFQCIRAHGAGLFKNPKLGLTVYAYGIANTVFTPLALVGTAWLLYTETEQALLGLLIILILGTVVAIVRGLIVGRKLKTLAGLPRHVVNMTIVSFVSYALWMRCGWLELVRKEALTNWTKGH